jgi:hypothetical protein
MIAGNEIFYLSQFLEGWYEKNNYAYFSIYRC